MIIRGSILARPTFKSKVIIWVIFYSFIILDILFLFIFASFRIDRQSLIFFLPLDKYTIIWLFAGLLLQTFLVFIGFRIRFFYEPKYEIYPHDDSPPDISYHYFGRDQLLAFIDTVANSLGSTPVKYHKIFVLKDITSSTFSFNFLGRRNIVLDPALLQIAQTQELRASIVHHMMMLRTRLSLVRTVQYQSQYLWTVILLPPVYIFIREFFKMIFLPDNYPFDLRYSISILFAFIALIVAVLILRPLHLAILDRASKRVIFLADLLAADIVGKRAMINMLIKQGQRWEVTLVLLEEFRWLDQLENGKIYSYDECRLLQVVQIYPLDKLDVELARRMAPMIYIRDKIYNLREYYGCNFIDEEFMLQEAREKILDKRNNYIDEIRQRAATRQIDRIPDDARLSTQTELVDWGQFDTNKDAILSQKDIEILINAIDKKKVKNSKRLFAYEVGSSGFISVESRILNVFRNVYEIDT